ncbi:hypothetical protein BC826DRAFT_213895 [Russula brevipes]|nr:hypothetical protein BC826DRAFT_213895 [Russula brevipes]
MSLRPNPASIDRVSTPPMAVEAPPIKDSASMDKSSAAGLALKSRTRGSTVSSQFRPRTPPIPNGRISRRPSVSSLASSAAVLSNYPVQPTSVEPRQEGVVAPLATSSMEDPFANPFENVQPPVAPRPVGPAMPVPEPSGVAARNVWAVAPVDVPLPPPSQVVYAM